MERITRFIGRKAKPTDRPVTLIINGWHVTCSCGLNARAEEEHHLSNRAGQRVGCGGKFTTKRIVQNNEFGRVTAQHTRPDLPEIDHLPADEETRLAPVLAGVVPA